MLPIFKLGAFNIMGVIPERDLGKSPEHHQVWNKNKNKENKNKNDVQHLLIALL